MLSTGSEPVIASRLPARSAFRAVDLVHQPELSVRRFPVGGIEEDSAIDERAMDVGDGGADIAETVRSSGRRVLLFQVIDIARVPGYQLTEFPSLIE